MARKKRVPKKSAGQKPGGWRALLGKLNDLRFATASEAVDAVRYEPKRIVATGGQQLARLPGEKTPAAVGGIVRGVGGTTERLASKVEERYGPAAGSFVRWSFGAAGGVLDRVSASAIDELGRGDELRPGMLTPHPHVVGVLMLDMRGFSRLTVELDDSQHLTDRIGEYLTEMTQVVERHRGLVFDYTGDGLLAVFLPELVRKQEAALVHQLAGPLVVDLHTAFRALHERWKLDWASSGRRGSEIGLGVGISYGSATIGLMGPKGKKYFGIVGPPVNLAAFLCSQAPAGSALIDAAAFGTTGSGRPPGAKTVRLRSPKLHQRLEAIRITPDAPRDPAQANSIVPSSSRP